MIELKNLCKTYRIKKQRNTVLDNVNLKINDKKNIAIIGKNGAGKSTLLRLLCGSEMPDSGSIHTDQHLSWPVALSGSFQGHLTGKENAQFVCRIYSNTIRETRERIKFVKEFSELGEHFHLPVGTYSSGMRARLGFALSMAFDFDYLVIDETISVGDKRFKEKCNATFEDKTKNTNVIMVSHNMSLLKKYCDIGLLVNDGQVQMFDSVEAGIQAYEKIA